MLKLVLGLFFVLPSLPGKSLDAHSAQLIEAQEGRNVTLRHNVQPPINLQSYTLDWKRIDGNFPERVLYARRHGKENVHPEMKQYSHRVLVNREDLIRGVMSLTIVSVELSDSGQYRAYVPQLKEAFYFNLVVKKADLYGTKREDLMSMKPLVNVTGNPDVATNELRHRWYIFIPGGVALIFIGGLTWSYYKNHRRQKNQENSTEL